MTARILGLALALALICAGTAAAQVLYVGDSLGVGTEPYLRDQLGGVELDVDAKTSRPSGAGVDVLGAAIAPEHEVVVFDLGTNDDPGAPDALAANLAAAREIADDRCVVVATLNRPPLNGVTVDGLNRVLLRFALTDPATELVDWHAAVAEDPGLLLDGVHARPEGYALRGGLFAEAIGACLAGGGGGAPSEPDIPEPDPDHQPRTELPEPDSVAPPPPGAPGPVHELAVELARSVAIGAEFG